MISRITYVFFAAAMMLTIAPAAAQPAIPDLVTTVDGGRYRGTIVEMAPGDHVTLLLPSGELRRFAAAEVVTAGPVADEAPTPAPASTPAPPPPAPHAAPFPDRPDGSAAYPARIGASVRVRIISDRPRMTLSYQSGIGAGAVGNSVAVITQYQTVCMAPCDTELPIGNHSFVVEDERGRARAVRHPVAVESDGTLEIGVESRALQRRRRWLVTGGLLVASLSLITIGALDKSCTDSYGYNDCSRNWAIMAPGLALLGAAYGTGMAAVFAFDRGRVEFRGLP